MPTPFILPANPSFGSQLGQQLGQGLGAGINQGISSRLSGMLKQKQEKAGIGAAINQYAKRYEKGQFTPDVLAKIQNRASQFIDEGASKDEAALAAFSEFDNRLGEWAEGKTGTAALESLRNPSKKKSFGDDLLGSSEDNIKRFAAEKGFQDLKKLPAKAAYPFVNVYDTLREYLSPASLANLDLAKQGYSPEEIAMANKEIQKDLPWPISATPPEPVTPKFLEKTGGVGPGETVLERAGQNYLIGGIPAVISGLFGETAESFGAPEEVKIAAEVAGFVAGLYTGKLKGPAKKLGQRILANAERKALSSGRPVGEIIAEAQKVSGVDLGKVSEGNAAEINKLDKAVREFSNESPNVSEKVKAAEKTVFNPEAAIKEREAHGKKLEKSPYKEYFEIENKKARAEATKSPEALAKQAETSARLQPQIDKLERSIDLDRKQLKRDEIYAKNYVGEGKARIESNLEGYKKRIDRKLEELKDLRYELKNGRPRPTEAQLEIDAQKAADKIVSEVRNPTPENMKAFEKQLEMDQRFLERAQKIKERGELAKDFKPDEHIRIMEKYQKAYDAMVLKLKDEIQSLKGARDAESLKKIADNREAIKRLEQRQKRHKGNITNQKDKIIALKSIEGPSGALYKNQIRRTQNDLAEFQKDFAQFKKSAETKAEIGTQHKAQKAVQESGKEFERMEKAGEKVGKNPTKENIQEAAKETGIEPEKIKKETEDLGDLIKKNAEKVKDGTATQKDISTTENFMKEYLNPYKNAKSAAFHFVVGTIVGAVEDEFGYRIPQKWLYGGATLLGKPTRQIGRGIGFGLGHSFVNFIYEKAEGNKLKNLRKNPIEYTKYVQNLRKRYGPKRINKMIEYSKS
jgi:hypothetical protein